MQLFDAPPKTRRLVFSGFLLVLLAVYVWPLWRDTTTWGGTFDWGYFFFMQEVSRKTVLEFHEFPLWNPYYCGGAVHLANPQTYFLSLTFIPVLIFGTPIGMRIMITAALLLCFDSNRRLARHYGMSESASLAAGAGFAICGAMAQQLGGGHVGWFGFALFPYLLLAFERALDGKSSYVVLAAFLMAWIAGHWGVYQYPYACMMIGSYALFVGWSTKRLPRAMAIVFFMVVGSAGLAALRLVPLVEFVREHPRTTIDRDYTYPWEWFNVYIWRHTRRHWGSQHYQWPEYGNYFGFFGAALFVIGARVIWKLRRARWPILATIVVFLVLSMGNIPGAPWWLLRKLPFFSSLRVPSRFTMIVGMLLCICIGFAFDHLFQWARARGEKQKKALVGVTILFLAYFVDVAQFNRLQWNQTFRTPVPTDPISPDFHNVSGIQTGMYRFPRVNRGSLSCFEESPLPISRALKAELPIEQQERARDTKTGTVTRVRWSPNRLVLDIDFETRNRVVVNQNFSRHWRSTEGEVMSHNGLLAVELPAGQRRIELWFWPRSFSIGLGISAATFALLICFLGWNLKRGRARHEE